MASFVLPESQNYGLDLSCLQDLTSDMAEVTGRLLLGQALARRIGTERGTLINDPNYGYGVTTLLDDDINTKTIAQIGALIDAEFQKDTRVLSSSTSVVFSNNALLITSNIRDGIGPFVLVLAASQVTVAILSVSQ